MRRAITSRGESTGTTTTVQAASNAGGNAAASALGDFYVGIEGVILAVFLAVVARLSTIYALLLRLAPARAPSLPSDQPRPQPTPEDQPAQSRAPGRTSALVSSGCSAFRGAVRGTASTCSCIVQTVLSGIVAFYCFLDMSASEDGGDWRTDFMAIQIILFSYAGVIHGSFCREVKTPFFATSTPDGVDPFEYFDMMTAPTMWMKVWVALSATSLALSLVANPQLSGMVKYPVLFATSAVLAVSLMASPPQFAVKLNKPFYTQPGCTFVRAALLTRGVSYALGLLCLFPGPSKWRWLLASTNSTRVLHVLVALRGNGQGVADAAVEVTDHVADEVV